MYMKERKRWLFLGLPFTFTVYEITDERLTITEGFFSKRENACYMYKVSDVERRASLLERMVGLGTVICYTSDVTHPTLELKHIKHSKDVMEALLEASEAHRIKRRTVNMQSLDADDLELEELS